MYIALIVWYLEVVITVRWRKSTISLPLLSQPLCRLQCWDPSLHKGSSHVGLHSQDTSTFGRSQDIVIPQPLIVACIIAFEDKVSETTSNSLKALWEFWWPEPSICLLCHKCFIPFYPQFFIFSVCTTLNVLSRYLAAFILAANAHHILLCDLCSSVCWPLNCRHKSPKQSHTSSD